MSAARFLVLAVMASSAPPLAAQPYFSASTEMTMPLSGSEFRRQYNASVGGAIEVGHRFTPRFSLGAEFNYRRLDALFFPCELPGCAARSAGGYEVGTLGAKGSFLLLDSPATPYVNATVGIGPSKPGDFAIKSGIGVGAHVVFGRVALFVESNTAAYFRTVVYDDTSGRSDVITALRIGIQTAGGLPSN